MYPLKSKKITRKRLIFNEKWTLQWKVHQVSQKTYGYGVFSFCEIKGHAHNFGEPYFESL